MTLISWKKEIKVVWYLRFLLLYKNGKHQVECSTFPFPNIVDISVLNVFHLS